MIEKTIKIEFNGQSKSVIEKVGISYTGTVDELKALGITNESILEETVELQTEASKHARSSASGAFARNR